MQLSAKIASQLFNHLPFGVLILNDAAVAYHNAYMQEQFTVHGLSADMFCHSYLFSAKKSLMAGVADLQPITVHNRKYFVGGYELTQTDYAFFVYPFAFNDNLQQELTYWKEQCQDFQEIYRNSFDGIFVTDGQGITLLVNEGCERNYDIKAEELIGQHVSVFEKRGWIRPVIAGRVIEERQRITATQETKSGKTIMVTGIPLFDDAGNVRKVIINSRDTTELIQLQEDLSRAQERLRRVESEITQLRQENLNIEGVVLNSTSMQKIAGLAIRVAKVDTTVLISGESGTGKEVLARLIHKESSRCDGPFIKINCGAIPRDLLESELFGYESGAFTGALKQGKIGMIELANHGTLFLDEIGELPLELQVKLLQVLQDRNLVRVGGTRNLHINIRVIAATNRNLEEMVEQKQFRSDLYYRLNVIPINVPPLRMRKDDVLPLLYQFLDEFNKQYKFQKRFSEQALRHLLEYAWPGNVRELRNLVERLVVTSSMDMIETDDLPESAKADHENFMDGLDLKSQVALFEERMVREALKKYGTTRAVANQLKISQSSVVRKLKMTSESHTKP